MASLWRGKAGIGCGGEKTGHGGRAGHGCWNSTEVMIL